LKVDANGNKLWETVLTQFNGSEISSCVEKQNDVFYLGIGGYSSGKLYKFDLTNLTIIDNQFRQPDAQLSIKNGKLFRGILEPNAAFYQTVKLKAYTIN
jgi:outer membrane protein assembly factor BamB